LDLLKNIFIVFKQRKNNFIKPNILRDPKDINRSMNKSIKNPNKNKKLWHKDKDKNVKCSGFKL
jgi:hypothetical protein